jgi:hypothetical protein
MTVSQILSLKNEGNAMASFTWEEPKNNKLWKIEPLKGTVDKQKSAEIKITFSPIDQKYKGTQIEDLKCLVENGNPILLPVTGSVNEATCSLVNEVLDFKNVHVGSEEQREFMIKNEFKYKTAFLINNPAPGIMYRHF